MVGLTVWMHTNMGRKGGQANNGRSHGHTNAAIYSSERSGRPLAVVRLRTRALQHLGAAGMAGGLGLATYTLAQQQTQRRTSAALAGRGSITGGFAPACLRPSVGVDDPFVDFLVASLVVGLGLLTVPFLAACTLAADVLMARPVLVSPGFFFVTTFFLVPGLALPNKRAAARTQSKHTVISTVCSC